MRRLMSRVCRGCFYARSDCSWICEQVMRRWSALPCCCLVARSALALAARWRRARSGNAKAREARADGRRSGSSTRKQAALSRRTANLARMTQREAHRDKEPGRVLLSGISCSPLHVIAALRKLAFELIFAVPSRKPFSTHFFHRSFAFPSAFHSIAVRSPPSCRRCSCSRCVGVLADPSLLRSQRRVAAAHARVSPLRPVLRPR